MASQVWSLTPVKVSAPVPVFETLTLAGEGLVVPTVPEKLRLAGLTEREAAAADPDPLNETMVGEPGASLATLSAPERLPAALGQNFTL